MSPREIDCLRCGATFTRPKRSRAHFCSYCRGVIASEQGAERKQRWRDVQQRLAAEHAEFYTDEQMAAFRERLAEVAPGLDLAEGREYREALYAGRLRMPDGSGLPAGPDEGTTTFFLDLADWLDVHAVEVARHSWWSEHPHWNYRLHDQEVAEAYLEAA